MIETFTDHSSDPAPRNSLEFKLEQTGGPMSLLRDSLGGRFRSPYPDQYTSWQEEQAAWASTAILLDQSHHMTDVYIKGPDTIRLLSESGTNSFSTFGTDRAKHLIVCAPDGNMIGSTVLFGLDREEVSLVGPAAAANWIQYLAERGRYDVEIYRDERTRDAGAAQRRVFRFEIEGPAAAEILTRASGGTVTEVPFFRMNRFEIAGRAVRGLSHTMAAVPGSPSGGLEIFGPAGDGPAVWDALMEAGADLGLVRGGMYAYYTGGVESGYAAQPTPAVYSNPGLRDYRKWLSGDGYEGTISIGGSFVPPSIDGYYVTPYDFGYSHLVKFDHDFVGREALEQVRDRPHRRKVWLEWNNQDVRDVYADSLFAPEERRPKYLETPLARYARVMVDSVMVGDRPIGVSTLAGYTVNIGHWSSIAFVDEVDAIDGAEAVLIWGEPHGGSAKPHVERHVQRQIRVRMRLQPLTAH